MLSTGLGGLMRRNRIQPLVRHLTFRAFHDLAMNFLATIDKFFGMSDGYLKERVPPLALVRCSRGGKTRALLEIAHWLRNRDKKLAVFFVSFSDITDLTRTEQRDPLQRLLRRIVFKATRLEDTRETFAMIRQRLNPIDPMDSQSWLGDKTAVLLVDELNNLDELTAEDSDAAVDYRFPRTYNLSMAQKIAPLLVTLRQALRCGSIPGLIYDQRPLGMKEVRGNRMHAVQKYNELSSSRPEMAFRGLLESFLTSDVELVPAPLHILFDTSFDDETDTASLCWIPLQYVMKKVRLPNECWLHAVAKGLVDLCQVLFNPRSKDKSGDSWEAAFVILFLLRCSANRPDALFLPGHWFDDSPKVSYNIFQGEVLELEKGVSRRKLMSECKTWDELQRGVKAGNDPVIVVLYPTYAMFEKYDAFVLLYKGGELRDARGFQMKKGSTNPDMPPLSTIRCSFLIKGSAPAQVATTKGWVVPSDTDIAKFFGVSGQNWTPSRWEQLKNTFPPAPT